MTIKQTVLDSLRLGNLEPIAELAIDKRRVLGALTTMTYQPDPLVAWRAIEAMGMAAERVAEADSGYVREHMRRLYWLILEESGGICWRAPECMAEVAARTRHHNKLEAYVPIAYHLITELAEEDLDHFYPGCLWAIGRLHALADEDLDLVLPRIVRALDAASPQSRGMAVWCLQQVGRTDMLSGRADLAADEGPVVLYEDRELVRTTVSALMRPHTVG